MKSIRSKNYDLLKLLFRRQRLKLNIGQVSSWLLKIHLGCFLIIGIFTVTQAKEFGNLKKDKLVPKSYSHAGPDTEKPEPSSFSPANGAINVSVNTTLVVTFNEPIQSTGLNQFVQIRRVSDDETVRSFAMNDPEIAVIDGVTLTLTPNFPLLEGIEYYVVFPGNAVEDIAGNDYDGFVSSSEWRFTTGDFTPPTLISTSPANGATGVANDTPIILTFSEPVQPTSINNNFIRIRRSSNHFAFHQIEPEDAQVTIDGNVVTIVPTGGIIASLEDEVGVYIGWSSTAFEDLAGNYFSGLFSATDYQFTVDNGGPSVTSFVSPADLETNVAPDANITIEYSELLIKGTGNVTIKRNNTIVLETIDINSSQITISGNQLTIDPTDPIYHGSPVSVAIDAGALVDALGNASSALLFNDLNFTIRPAYEQTSLSPADVSTDVAIDEPIVMTFNGDIFKTNSDYSGDRIELYNITDNMTRMIAANSEEIAVSGNVVTITPDDPLDYGKQYRISVLDVLNGLFVDEFGFKVGYIGNGYIPAGIDTNGDNYWTITTEADPTPAAPTLTSPAHQATGVSITPTMTWEAVSGATLYTLSITEQGEEDPIYDGSSITGTSLDLGGELEDPLEYATTYVWKMKAHTDKHESEWTAERTFTTENNPDQTAPSQVSLSPTNGTTGLGIYPSIRINFDEPIQEGTGTIGIYKYTGDEVHREYSAGTNSVYLSISGTQLTINVGSELEEETRYFVKICATCVEDLAGNSFSGITNKDTWTFSTGEFQSPVVQSVSPTNTATDVALDAVLTAIFDETVLLHSDEEIYIKYVSDHTNWAVLSTASSEVSVTGNILTIDPNADFPPNTALYIEIPQYGNLTGDPVLQDEATNAFDGLGESDWSFTTGDGVNTWDGTSWSSGSPDASTNVIFEADYSFTDGEVLEINDFTTLNGVPLTIESGATLVVHGDMDINGLFIVESGASLISYEGHTVEGNVMVRRNASFGSSDKSIGKYSFVCLPVTSTANLMNRLGDRVYSYNEAHEDNELNGYTLMNELSVIGQGSGYAATYSPEVLEFVGKPTVGSVTKYLNASQNSGFHLVGNPYSAAIDVDEFFSDNSSISSIAIWDDGGASGGSQQSGTFIQVNSMGSITATSNLNENTFNGNIGTGQGFFVETAGDISVTFQEDQRVYGENGDGHFFRYSGPKSIKLSLGNGEVEKQTLIALDDEASSGYDIQKDAVLRKSGLPVEMYSIAGGDLLAIQTIAPDEELVIYLGYEVSETGTFTIRMNETTGLSSCSLELVDHLLNQTIALYDGAEYTFTSKSGEFNNRFELNVKSRVLAIEKQDVQVYAYGQTIYIELPEGTQRTFYLIGLDGTRILTSQLNRSARIQTNLPTGIYLITDGERTHKILLK